VGHVSDEEKGKVIQGKAWEKRIDRNVRGNREEKAVFINIGR